jgi:primase-polymerase (primpol)-like protein
MRPAKSNDPATWGDIVDARERVQNGDADGPGFVFAASDNLCGIDLDDCARPDRSLEPWAEEIVRRFDTYAELSPSGTGVKLFLQGVLTGGRGVKRGNIEVYGRNRYFTVTGLRMPGCPSEVRYRDRELDACWRATR